MNDEEMKQALEHDAANKAANSTGPTQAHNVEVPFLDIMHAMERKNAMLAKSVSMALLDLARQSAAAAFNTASIEEKLQHASVVAKMLELADLADQAANKNAAMVG